MNMYTKPKLNRHYVISVQLRNGFSLISVCKFIRVTKTGYNFLNVDTGKCIFRKHWYKSKKTGEFFVHRSVSIKEIYKGAMK